MRIHKLTNLILDLNAALASAKCPNITCDDAWQHISEGTLFEWLTERLGFSGAISVLEPVDRLELVLEWDHLRRRREPSHRDGQGNGLCLLLEYLVEGILRRCESRDYRLTPETCGAVVPERE